TDSLSSSDARRCTATSVSSSLIRRRAARNSSRSAELSPGSSPRSISSCRRHLEIDRSLTSSSRATSRTGSPPPTRSSARRRNSAGYPFPAINDLPDHHRGRLNLETGPNGTGATALTLVGTRDGVDWLWDYERDCGQEYRLGVEAGGARFWPRTGLARFSR